MRKGCPGIKLLYYRGYVYNSITPPPPPHYSHKGQSDLSKSYKIVPEGRVGLKMGRSTDAEAGDWGRGGEGVGWNG